MINRRHKFPEPPEVPAHHQNITSNSSNSTLLSSSDNNKECVVVSVSTSSSNITDPTSGLVARQGGRTVVTGHSSTAPPSSGPFSNQQIIDHHNNSSSSISSEIISGKSKSTSSLGFLSSILSAFSDPIPSSHNNNKESTVNTNDEVNSSVLQIVFRRLSVLVSLLLLQSMSQFVLEYFEDVVQANIVIPLFLTMLVGAGGNAGNQSAVRAIAMLAKGEFTTTSKLKQIMPFIKRECVIGFICAFVLSAIGALRVFAHQVMRRSSSGSGDDSSSSNNNDLLDPASSPPLSSSASSTPQSTLAAVTVVAPPSNNEVELASIGTVVLAISFSLFLIVAFSAMIGVVLPFLFMRCGMSPEHAAPAIQVIMDVLGVFLTCIVCSTLLPSSSPSPPNNNNNQNQNQQGNGG